MVRLSRTKDRGGHWADFGFHLSGVWSHPQVSSLSAKLLKPNPSVAPPLHAMFLAICDPQKVSALKVTLEVIWLQLGVSRGLSKVAQCIRGCQL